MVARFKKPGPFAPNQGALEISRLRKELQEARAQCAHLLGVELEVLRLRRILAEYGVAEEVAEARYDSGYTSEELDAILDGLAKGARFTWPGEPMSIALTIGLSDGDVVALSDRGTVLLSTPREEIDRRIAAIKEAMQNGATLDKAVEAVGGET